MIQLPKADLVAGPWPEQTVTALTNIVHSSRSTVPASGSPVCRMRLKSVDFPAPSGPSSVTSCFDTSHVARRGAS